MWRLPKDMEVAFLSWTVLSESIILTPFVRGYNKSSALIYQTVTERHLRVHLKIGGHGNSFAIEKPPVFENILQRKKMTFLCNS